MSASMYKMVLYADSRLPNRKGEWVSPQDVRVIFKDDRVIIKDLSFEELAPIELRSGVLEYKDILVCAEPRQIGMFAVARLKNNKNSGIFGIVSLSTPINNDIIEEFRFWYGWLDNNEVYDYVDIEDVEDAFFYEDDDYYIQNGV